MNDKLGEDRGEKARMPL